MEYNKDSKGGSVIRITKKLKTRLIAGGIAAAVLLISVLTVSLMIKSRDNEIISLEHMLEEYREEEAARKLAEEEAKKQPTITAEHISTKIEALGEIHAAKLTYNGVLLFEKGSFLTKQEFLMSYRCELRAGVQLQEITAEVTDTAVTVTLPRMEVLTSHIDESSIRFYDITTMVFAKKDKEDVVVAMQKALEDVNKNADIEGLKSDARQQLVSLLTGLLDEFIGDRELIFKDAPLDMNGDGR